MIRTIMLAAMLTLSIPVFAQANTAPNPCENIAEATKDKNSMEINTILEACRSTSNSVKALLPEITPERATEWGDVANTFASAIGNAAKQLGIATNEFLNSPAGILLALVLLVNYAGGAIFGFPFTIFSMYIMYSIIRWSMTQDVKYEPVQCFWGLFTYHRKTYAVNPDRMSDGKVITVIITGIGLLILNLIVWSKVT